MPVKPEVDEPDERTGAVAGHAEEVEVDEGAAATPCVAALPGDEGNSEDDPGQRDPPRDGGRPRPRRAGAAPARLDERQQQGEDRAAEQDDAHRVDVETRRPGPARCGEPASGEDHRDQGDGEVDEEDPAPPGIRTESVDDEPADDRPDRRRDADGRPEHAERTTTLASREHLLDEAGDLRVEDAACRTLDEAGDDEHRTAGCEAAREAGSTEEHDPRDEHGSPTDDVAHASGPDEGEPEGEGIAGDDPLEVAGRCPDALLDRRQRHVDDADVEQRHEACDEADGEGSPPPGVRRLVGSGLWGVGDDARPRVVGHEGLPTMARVASSRRPSK
jgi:hypothetical protein